LPGVSSPDFLDLPARPPKPRARGITHVIDPGLSAREAEATMDSVGEYVDLVRFGWGTAYITRELRRKLDLYKSFSVPTMLGGTLTELAWLQGKVDGLRRWLDELGIEHVEVSSGVVPMPSEEKAALIATLARERTVYAEVGEKDPHALMAPYRWVALIREALEAGATQVVCEGRADGSAGVYRPDGEVRTGLVDEIAHEIEVDRLIFEAPQRAQQIFFIEKFGSDVNVGNIDPSDVVSLETLRVGLRADTLMLFHGDRRA
jgi:phosphosulfolactate synthase